MQKNTAIRVQNLSKRYRIGRREKTHDTLAGALGDLLTHPLRNLRNLRRLTRFDDNVPTFQPASVPRASGDDVIWALKDVSFEVERGEVVGIIGRNGAGKSTLLKILSRITYPTRGRVELRGRVSSLLEVGTGFHPELTGRENIYLNGTILGMTKAEIDRKFDEIVGFSGVEKFIDTPVKRYSSGMRVRLAFSVAAHLEPEILLIDEVLAVGDADFQKKCLGKMGEVAREGRTVLFVSHNMGAVGSLCQWGMLLERGRVAYQGEILDVIARYTTRRPETNRAVVVEDAEGSGFRLLRDSREIQFTCGHPVRFDFEIICPQPVREVTAGLILFDALDNPVVGTSSKFQKIHGRGEAQRWRIHCDLGEIPLNSGLYFVSVWFGNRHRDYTWFSKAFALDILPADPFDWGNQVPKTWGHFYWRTGWQISSLDDEE